MALCHVRIHTQEGDSVLTPKQQRFVDEYLVDLNASAAARRAGYSVRTANRIATENLSKPVIAAAIAAAKAQRSERTRIDADWVLRTLAEEKAADLAGCSYSAMFMRLRKDTPETCVEMGGADRGRRWRGTAAPSGPRPEPGKPLQDLPKTRSFATVNGTIDKRRIDAAAPAQALPGVKVTIAPKPRERFDIDPASVPSTFGRIGEYAATGSPLERAYGGAR